MFCLYFDVVWGLVYEHFPASATTLHYATDLEINHNNVLLLPDIHILKIKLLYWYLIFLFP